mgnify:CR=1 FL=1
MTREARTAVARRAATARWVRKRFGSPSFETLGFPEEGKELPSNIQFWQVETAHHTGDVAERARPLVSVLAGIRQLDVEQGDDTRGAWLEWHRGAARDGSRPKYGTEV